MVDLRVTPRPFSLTRLWHLPHKAAGGPAETGSFQNRPGYLAT
jgi:hypothetical protein